MEIRRVKRTEMDEAIRLVLRTFDRYEAPGYADKGVASFREFVSKAFLSRLIRKKELEIYGFFDPMLKGVIATRNLGHISLLFVDEQYHRMGITTALFSFVKARARGAGRSRMSVNSSPYAVPVYQKWGFLSEGPEQVMDGIRFTRMSMEIGE